MQHGRPHTQYLCTMPRWTIQCGMIWAHFFYFLSLDCDTNMAVLDRREKSTVHKKLLLLSFSTLCSTSVYLQIFCDVRVYISLCCESVKLEVLNLYKYEKQRVFRVQSLGFKDFLDISYYHFYYMFNLFFYLYLY